MAPVKVTVPDIGDFDAVPVIEVLVAVGDTVAVEQALVVLESEKATMEVPSPAAGTVAEVAVSVGDTVSTGDLILTLEGGDDAPAADDGGDDADQQPDDDGAAADEKPDRDAPADDRDDAAADDDGQPAAPEGHDESDAPSGAKDSGHADLRPDGTALPPPPPPNAIYAGPAARRLARVLGINLTEITGTGREGRITREDVAAFGQTKGLDQRSSTGDAPAGAGPLAGLPAWPEVDFAAFGEVEREPLSRIARISGPYLARNWVTIPHVTQFDQADITALEEFRKEINAAHADQGVKVTMVSLLLKACAATLRAFPHFNASLDGDELVLKRYYHLGFAADTPQGLMVPVIRDVDRKGLLEIASELTTLSSAAREGTISRDQMQGGTFTISSLGGIGGTAFTPIINAPEVAILGVSRSTTAPVWQNGTFVPRLMLPLSLSYDHRVIDGAAAARFTTHLCDVLSDPRKMLL